MILNFDELIRRNILNKYKSLDVDGDFGKKFSKKEQSIWIFAYELARKQSEGIMTASYDLNIIKKMLKIHLLSGEFESFTIDEFFEYLKDK